MKKALFTLLLAFIANVASADDVIDIVKIVNFDCAFSYSSLSNDSDIKFYINNSSHDSKIITAPIATDINNTYRERLYYTIKLYKPEILDEYLVTVFKATQEEKITLITEESLISYLHMAMPEHSEFWLNVKAKSYEQEVNNSMLKAYRFLYFTKDITLPAYVFLKQGRPISVLSHNKDESIDKIRDRLIIRFNDLMKK